jgi:hypothetical protein
MDVGLMEGFIFGLPLISVMPFLIIFCFSAYTEGKATASVGAVRRDDFHKDDYEAPRISQVDTPSRRSV